MKKIFYLLLLIGTISACNNTTTNKENPPTEKKAVQQAPAQGKQMPSIPVETITHIFENCDYIDYVFYNTNFSMSQNEKASIQTAISHVSATPAILNPNCKAIGRIFYQIEAVNVLEADLYFQEGCTYLVFLEKNKPKYANLLTEDGIAYLNNILQKAGSATLAQ